MELPLMDSELFFSTAHLKVSENHASGAFAVWFVNEASISKHKPHMAVKIRFMLATGFIVFGSEDCIGMRPGHLFFTIFFEGPRAHVLL